MQSEGTHSIAKEADGGEQPLSVGGLLKIMIHDSFEYNDIDDGLDNSH